MYPVTNAVEVSTDKIREAFEKAAVPDFNGTVSVHVRVLPTAANEVEFTVERKRNEQIDRPGTIREQEAPHVTNDRVNIVRMKFMEFKLILATPVVCVSGSFVKGILRGFIVQEVEQ